MSNTKKETARSIMTKLVPLSNTAYEQYLDAIKSRESRLCDYWKGQYDAYLEVDKILKQMLTED